MDYTITYKYKNEENKVLLQAMPNILGAIGEFYESYTRDCEIIKVELY